MVPIAVVADKATIGNENPSCHAKPIETDEIIVLIITNILVIPKLFSCSFLILLLIISIIETFFFAVVVTVIFLAVIIVCARYFVGNIALVRAVILVFCGAMLVRSERQPSDK